MAVTEHRPVLIVITRQNCSGKTSVTSKILHHEWMEDSEYINPVNVARDIFGDWNDRQAVLKAANYCNDWRKKCLVERPYRTKHFDYQIWLDLRKQSKKDEPIGAPSAAPMETSTAKDLQMAHNQLIMCHLFYLYFPVNASKQKNSS